MPTYQVRIYKQKGFTLLELMFSLAIIAFVVGIGIPKLGRSLNTQLKATTRRLVVLNKELHSYARLKNKTYRLVIDFGGDKKKPNFFVESATSRQLLEPPDATPTPSKIKSFTDAPVTSAFSPDKEILKKPVEFPEGVKIEDVESINSEKPIIEGRAYVVFFPEGLVQQSVIHLTDGKKIHWSLIVNPLTGRTEIQTTYIKLKDLLL